MGFIDKVLPKENWKISLIAAFIPAILILMIVGFSLRSFGDYGWGIFVVTPFSIGFMATLLKGLQSKISFSQSIKVTSLALLFFCLLLILFAVKGAICILMAAPIGLLLAYIGSFFAFLLLNKLREEHMIPIVLLINALLLPSFISVETTIDKSNKIFTASTSVIVEGTKQEVWNNLIEFKKIKAPLDLVFRYGVSYPIDSEVRGTGVGSIRYCNFSTGSFVESVDIWNEPHHLHFYVEEQPIPMKELSPYDIHPRHLHGYFASTKREFRLEALGDGSFSPYSITPLKKPFLKAKTSWDSPSGS
jgi:hypothetical protein